MTRTIDPYDELAALFLTEPDERQAPAAAPPVVCELLVVGHLPVRADLWLTPYADAVARGGGATVLLRLDAEEPALQVLQADGVSLGQEPVSLAEAIGGLAPHIRRWVVRPPLDTSPREILQAGGDRITILTSADELARVHAFERIKAFVEAAAAAGERPPTIGLAVLGADPDTARRTCQLINHATRASLEIEVPLVVCLPRMDAEVQARQWLRFAGTTSVSPASVLGWIRDASVAAPAEPAAVAEPARGAPPAVAAAAVSGPGTEAIAREPDVVEFLTPMAMPKPNARITPDPTFEVEPKEPAAGATERGESGRPTPLARFIEGLTPLPVRCPGHERLELAVDKTGRLHLITLEPHLRELAVVRSWARAHRELIGMACREQLIDPAAEAVCHVVSDRPASLADLHGSDLRLHVLAPVTVEGKQGWYAAPLNTDLR